MAKKETKKTEEKILKKEKDASSKKETVIEKVTEEKKDIQVKDVQEDVKKEKRKKFFDELKAFFILVLLIVAVVFGGWYWYTHIYDGGKPRVSTKEEKTVDEYQTSKYVVADSRVLDVVNDKYLVEHDDEKLYKVMNMQTEVLFEGNEEYSYFSEGIDGNFYVIVDEEADNENVLTIYKLVDKKLEETKQLMSSGVYFTTIQYKENGASNQSYTLGFVGTRFSYDEEMNEKNTTFISTLEGKDYELSNYSLVGDEVRLDVTAPVVTYDKNHIILGAKATYSEMVYGVYDLASDTIIVKPQYEGLYTNKGNYVAIKDGKAGIITDKLKKVVNFEYDFIAMYDNYYVVSKKDKMAIMDADYKLVTDFVFDYQRTSENLSYTYNICCLGMNTFASYQVGEKYVLVTNHLELERGIPYEKHETYVIDKKGQYETIVANQFVVSPDTGLIYSYDNTKKVATFYDSSLKEMYQISLESYDFVGVPTIRLLQGNTIEIQLDSSIYFDYETGDEIEGIKEYSALVNGVTIQYHPNKKQLTYSSGEHMISTIDLNNETVYEPYFKWLDENSFYYATEKEYLFIGKSK